VKPIIETERLVLREINPEHDFEGWAEACADADTMRFIGGNALNEQLAWRNMAMIMGHWAIHGFGFFSVIEKSSGKWIGRIGPWGPLGWPQPEIGWMIHPVHTRKGFAAEAGAACIDYAFNTLGWNDVIHMIADGNDGSIAVAEKIGSTYRETVNEIGGVYEGKAYIYGQSKA